VDSDAWIQKAMTAAFRKRVLGWSWSRVTESLGTKSTKPNIRTVQRREVQFAELVLRTLASLNVWKPGEFGRILKERVGLQAFPKSPNAKHGVAVSGPAGRLQEASRSLAAAGVGFQ
jgi:hypothetical protein